MQRLLLQLYLTSLVVWWVFAYHKFFGWHWVWPQTKEELICDGLSILMSMVLLLAAWIP